MADPTQVPAFIDANARHQLSTLRVINYAALAGREGVFEAGDFKVSAQAAPDGTVNVAPGVAGILARHSGGFREAYVGKFASQVTRALSPTDATVGGRSDLVVLRVLNPYVTEVGSSIPNPADLENGPYWDVVVVEGVPPNINTVGAYAPNWSAIPLARIVRPPNTTIVQQGHIVELRSLVDLSGERLVIVDNPPAVPPPIASQLWTGVRAATGDSQIGTVQTAWTNWPAEGSFDVPVPSWAKTADVLLFVNGEIDGNVYGEMRLTIDGSTLSMPPTRYNYNYARTIGPEQYVTMVAGTFEIPTGKAGKVVALRTQGHSLSNNSGTHPGKMKTHAGCYVSAQINFKKGVS